MGETHVPRLEKSLRYGALTQHTNLFVGPCTRQSIKCSSDRRFRALQQLEKAFVTIEQHSCYLLGRIKQTCLEQY